MRNEANHQHASRFFLNHLRSVVGFAVIFSLISIDSAFGQAFDALVFSKTAGFRHPSIVEGSAMMQQLAAANNFSVTFTEDANTFTAGGLAPYEVVVFLNTSGDVFNASQEAAFTSYIQGGKGYVGVHAASDTEAGWGWYVGLVGASFVNHSNIVPATIEVADRVHPSSSVLPKYWNRTDEWYNFNINPRNNVHVLATIDEGTYSGGTMGFDHPITWCHEYDGGRSWYTAGGHTESSYSEQGFRDHILNGVKWAAGNIGGDAEASVPSSFQKVTLDANVSSPMSLTVAPDNRVFFTERGGAVKVYRPAQQNTVVAGILSVSTVNEEGVLGIAVDPNFSSNQWVYILYSTSAAWEQRLSRFTMNGDTLNMGSEIILLVIPEQRSNCCHQAGSVQFGNNGELFISTGDNSNPFASDGYAPIDEQAGRSDWDAQKSASNRNDLRGKILRIIPQTNGTYTIPSGNLFPSDGSDGRAEVYAMGCRNPFRISVDPETGWVYSGDVGPDANDDSGTRGPKGYDEINQIRSAGNFGWPYCIADNQAYRDYNFATGVSGNYFNCGAPVNNSPNNTGSQTLPGSSGAFIWYPYATSSQFPELGTGGRTIMAGPVYHYSSSTPSSTKLPAYYDDTLFIYEFTRGWLKEVKLDDNGNILKINPFLQTMSFAEPLEMEIGPDGNMYMIEFGADWSGNVGSKLIRIEYTLGVLSPVAMASGTPDSGLAPLNVQFSSAGSFDPDGTIVAYEWDFTSNGSTDSTQANPSFTYSSNGSYTAKLTVRDNEQNTGVANVPIVVGNNRPVVTITTPVDGGFFDWNSIVNFQVSVTDAQDGSTGGGQIPCSSVTVQPYLGHDDHAHPLSQFNACSGAFVTQGDGTPTQEDLYHIVEGRYTDLGAPGSVPLTGTKQHILQPKRKQAEHWTTMSGIQTETTGDIQGGGLNIGFIAHGDYISFNPMNLTNISSVTYRAASAGLGGTVEVRVDSATGTLISTATIPVTGDWQIYTNVNASITNPGGTHQLYFVFKRNPGDDSLFNINWIDFIGDGVSSGSAVTIDLGTTDIGNGMTAPIVGDGDLVAATIGGRLAKQNVNPADDFYFYFAVDDAYAFNGSRPVNYITIDYYDTGTGTLTLQYDANDGNFYKSGGSVTLANTNTWKKHQYSVTDAYFGNRENSGSDFRIAMPVGVTRYLDIVAVSSNSSGGGQAPYPGTPFAVPGVIQAEQYDFGAQGVAFSDTTAGNSGGQFRSDNVDIETTTDAGGGFNVGWIDSGEMLEYTINVAVAGTYGLDMRVASDNASGSYHLEVDGVNLTGTKTIPNTGGWQIFTTLFAGNYTFTTGQKVVRVYMETGAWNFNYLQIQGNQSPFGGTARAIPGVVQAEDYDIGGEDTAYNDNDVGNNGGQYRTDNVDIEATTDTGGGYNVGWTGAGEWLEYTVNVNTTGDYAVKTRMAAGGAGGTFQLTLDGSSLGAARSIMSTGGWQTWTTIIIPGIAMTAGNNKILRFSVNSGDFNFNYVDFAFSGADVVSEDLDSTNFDDGMTHPQASDGDTIAATIGGHNCRQNLDPGAGFDFYMYFTVSDIYAFQGNKNNAAITLEYYDNGTSGLELHYDGASNPYAFGGSVARTNTNTWKTFTFNVTDAYFGNRQNSAADFRFYGGNTTFYFDTIIVFASSAPSPPGQASNPNPANGATLVNKNADLSWTAGSGATSHDVRFGTANPPPFIINQTGTTHDPGTMAVNTTYFWRIDEKNTAGTTNGVVWSFTTLPLPGAASAPNPANGATGVATSAQLSWTAGSNAASHDVRFGTANPPPFVVNQTGTTYNPGTLAGSTTYFLRIDEVNTSGTTTGTVWSFTTVASGGTPTLNVKVASGLTIDGSSSDWNLSEFVTKIRGGEFGNGDIALVGFDGGATVYRGAFVQVLPTNAADHTAKVYSRHDATYLYFLARIDDNQLQTQNGVAMNWANDCIEIYIDPTNNGGATTMSNSTSDIQLVIDPLNQKNVYMCTSGYTTQVLAGVTSAVTTDGTGWWCEVRIQKSALDLDIPANGLIGLDFNFRDNDNNNDPALTTVYTWAESSTEGFPSKIPDHWGDASLPTLPSGPVTISNSAFPSNADGWNIVVWKSGQYSNGTMAWSSTNGNPSGNMLAGASGATNNTDSCNREGGEINKAISTAGFNSIQVQYDLRFETDQTGPTCIGGCTAALVEGTCSDKIGVYYSTAGTAGPWTLLEQVLASSVAQNVWSTRTVNCPAGANNQANFAVRLRFQFNKANTDKGRLDNVKVIGTP